MRTILGLPADKMLTAVFVSVLKIFPLNRVQEILAPWHMQLSTRTALEHQVSLYPSAGAFVGCAPTGWASLFDWQYCSIADERIIPFIPIHAILSWHAMVHWVRLQQVGAVVEVEGALVVLNSLCLVVCSI